MITCKVCKTELNEQELICNICKYPIQGTEKEQASFIAKQIIQKGDVEDSIEQLNKSRWILFGLGALYVVGPFTPLMSSTSAAAIVISILLGFVFIGFGFLTFRKPKIALLIPLGMTLFYYFILLLINPFLLWSGFLWKMVVLIGLGYGYSSVSKSEKILKENKYLAEQLGYGGEKK